MNKKDIDPANLRIRPMNTEHVHAIAQVGSMYAGAPRPEYYRKKIASATGRAGIYTPLVAEARTTVSRVACKR
ncbi:MAG TPA: hypothetical protein VK463_04315 [Desulfomonilaceae bacterium]|nr:hypothetical protein [Desulfomonilaceae bacterium]